MTSKQLTEVTDELQDTPAYYAKSDSNPKTFRKNCGATFRATIPVAAALQTYLREEKDVSNQDTASTGDLIEQYVLNTLPGKYKEQFQLGNALSWDTRAEGVITDALEQEKMEQEARASGKNVAATADMTNDKAYMALEKQIAGFIKQNGESQETREQVLDVINDKVTNKKHKKALRAYLDERLPEEGEEVDLFA